MGEGVGGGSRHKKERKRWQEGIEGGGKRERRVHQGEGNWRNATPA